MAVCVRVFGFKRLGDAVELVSRLLRRHAEGEPPNDRQTAVGPPRFRLL